MTTRVTCIRHGETEWNRIGRWQGHAPVPLNATGQRQARLLAQYLAAHQWHFDALYSSPSPRALETARTIANALARPITTDARLQEVHLGDWQGLTRAEALARDPDHFAAFEADWYNVAPPNGETRNELKARLRRAFDDLTARHPDQHIALVSHGGSIGMLFDSLFGAVERPSLTNTSLTIVERDTPDANWQLVKVAWTPHLTGPAIGETW